MKSKIFYLSLGLLLGSLPVLAQKASTTPVVTINTIRDIDKSIDQLIIEKIAITEAKQDTDLLVSKYAQLYDGCKNR